MKQRKVSIPRETGETKIKLTLNLDGTGKYKISTGNSFFDHMLSVFSRHGYFDLEVICTGDIEVDAHHSVEDVGIVLGQAIKMALGEKRGIRRYGNAFIPLDEALSQAVVDLSGRPYLFFKTIGKGSANLEKFSYSLAEEFFRAVVNHSMINLHLEMVRGKNGHHCLESMFKAFGRALDQAVSREPRSTEIPSTKKVL
jgi:imidazoleglycerol-phosphate dehydratase